MQTQITLKDLLLHSPIHELSTQATVEQQAASKENKQLKLINFFEKEKAVRLFCSRTSSIKLQLFTIPLESGFPTVVWQASLQFLGFCTWKQNHYTSIIVLIQPQNDVKRIRMKNSNELNIYMTVSIVIDSFWFLSL